MWNTIRCAVQGRGHVKTDTPCQDTTMACHFHNAVVIALADGAGSAAFSDRGANVTVQTICALMIDMFNEFYTDPDGANVKAQIINTLLNELEKEAAHLQCDIKDLASTLLFAAVKDEYFILGHIGDGVIGYKKGDDLLTASRPMNGEFANATVFTTSKEALATMEIIKGEIGSIEGFVLMSDGTAASLYDKKKDCLAEVLKKIINRTKTEDKCIFQKQLKESFENVIINKTRDDCSIAIMAKQEKEPDFLSDLSPFEKCTLYQIQWNQNWQRTKKRIDRFDKILNYLGEERTLADIAGHLYLREVYAKKYVEKLRKVGLIEKGEVGYRRREKIENIF